VIGEDPSEARILQERSALIGGYRRRMGMVNELQRLGLGHFSLGCLLSL
jgi:hypothetical protein